MNPPTGHELFPKDAEGQEVWITPLFMHDIWEMRRTKEKGYDKWQDLAQSIYELVDYSLTMRNDITVVFIAHTQTDHDDNGYMFTRIKTSGRKLDKITLESKFSTVLISKCVDGRYVFETQANFSTAKSPMGAFESKEIDNDIVTVIKALEEV